MSQWEGTYASKLMSAGQAAQLVRSGDSIYAAGMLAIPLEFTQALAERRDQLEGVDFYGALSPFMLKIFDGEYKGSINYITIFSGPFERMMAPQGNINQMSVHLAELDRVIDERVDPTILAVNVSPPDAHGWMTYGPCGGLGQAKAQELASKVIVTVQKDMPAVYGEFNTIHVDDVDAIIETEVPVAELPGSTPGETELKIASHVAPLIEDGSTIQIGIGSVPGAVAQSLANKHDLGIHTEMFSTDMFELIKAGAVTGKRKNVKPGKVVYGFAAGSRELYDYLDGNPSTIIEPLSMVINAHECGKNDNFVSINTCLMVSVTGQVAAEAVDWTQISGTGGQLDLVRAARNSEGGMSFFVMPSTRTLKSGEVISSISMGLPPGTPVTTPRTDVQYIATEYGCVNLRYKSNMERVRAMISIAHPEFRQALRDGVEAETGLSVEPE